MPVCLNSTRIYIDLQTCSWSGLYNSWISFVLTLNTVKLPISGERGLLSSRAQNKGLSMDNVRLARPKIHLMIMLTMWRKHYVSHGREACYFGSQCSHLVLRNTIPEPQLLFSVAIWLSSNATDINIIKEIKGDLKNQP